jgi:hypothetical protein
MPKKDQNKPKRGLTAFMYYSQERRKELKKSEPNISFGGVAKKIGGEWKKLNDSKKSKFEKMAVKDKERYLKQMESYTPPADMDGGKKNKKKKDPNAPKRGLSSFMFYSKERRAVLKVKQPDIAFGEVAKKIGAEWKKLSDSKKSEYQKLAEKDKQRYLKEMANYKPVVNTI